MPAPACPQCSVTLAPGLKFCRACGKPTVDADTASSRACPACRAPVSSEQPFCKKCGVHLHVAEEHTAAATVGQQSQEPPRQPPRASSDGPPPKEVPVRGGDRGQRRKALLLMVCAIALAVGGGLATAVLRDEPPKPSTATNATPERRAESAATQQPATVTPTTETAAQTPTSSDDTAPEAVPTEPSEPTEQTTTAATSPTRAFREHWAARSQAQWDEAYRLLGARYKATNPKSRWIRGQQDYEPRVNVRRVTYVTSVAPGIAELSVEVITRDLGPLGNPRTCNRFYGRVRMIRENGEWRYDANNPRESRSGGFRGQKKPITRDDLRCRRLFG